MVKTLLAYKHAYIFSAGLLVYFPGRLTSCNQTKLRQCFTACKLNLPLRRPPRWLLAISVPTNHIKILTKDRKKTNILATNMNVKYGIKEKLNILAKDFIVPTR